MSSLLPAARIEFRQTDGPAGYEVVLVLARPVADARDGPTAAELMAFAAFAAAELFAVRCFTAANDSFRPDGVTGAGRGSRTAACRLVWQARGGPVPDRGSGGGDATVYYADVIGPSVEVRLIRHPTADPEALPTRAHQAAAAVASLPVPALFPTAAGLHYQAESCRVREKGARELWG